MVAAMIESVGREQLECWEQQVKHTLRFLLPLFTLLVPAR